MARQTGPLRLTGSLGNLSFYYHKLYGYLVRLKSPGRRGRLSPRTKENSDELCEASRTGKLIRQGMRQALYMKGDTSVTQRLTSCLSKIQRFDTTSRRGRRRVFKGLTTDAGKELLLSFAFTEEKPLGRVLHVLPEYSTHADRFLFKSMLPARDITWPAGATHVQLQCGIVLADTPGNTYRSSRTHAVILAIDGPECDAALFTEAALSRRGMLSGLFRDTGFRAAVAGVVFLREAGGELIPLKGESSMGVTGIHFPGRPH